MLTQFRLMRGPVVEHVVGMSAQVAAAVPLVIVTALIAHTQGLRDAGAFTIAVGLSAFIFAPAAWGMRPHIVIDNLTEFSALEYISARALTVAGASVATLILAIAMGVPALLALAVVLFRTCESAIDLDLAFTQVWHPNTKALTRFALLHTFKLIMVAIATALSFWFRGGSAPILIVCAALVAVAAALAVLLSSVPSLPYRPISVERLWSLFGRSKWFASANIAAAGINSAPRISLPALYSGDVLGVVGVSLSIGTFFGMAFYTTLLRFLPTFSAAESKPQAVRLFLLETLIVMMLSMLVSWSILPSITAVVFNFHSPEFMAISRNVLVANVFFSAGSCLPNLYKVTRQAWAETVCYVISFPVVVGLLALFPDLRDMPAVLVIAGATMALAALPALFLVRRQHAPADLVLGG